MPTLVKVEMSVLGGIDVLYQRWWKLLIRVLLKQEFPHEGGYEVRWNGMLMCDMLDVAVDGLV